MRVAWSAAAGVSDVGTAAVVVVGATVGTAVALGVDVGVGVESLLQAVDSVRANVITPAARLQRNRCGLADVLKMPPRVFSDSASVTARR